MADADLLTIHTDGAARGNPGPAAYAYVIERDGQPPIEEAGRLGETTNNQAEYIALVHALEHALELGSQYRVVVLSDSELMVKQLNGEYKVKNEDLRPLYEEAQRLRRGFTGGVTFRHVRREQNKRADQLCNEALDGLREQTRSAPQKSAKPKPPPKGDDLDARAIACLRAAAEAWRKGADSPTPEEVWRQLTQLLSQEKSSC